MVNRPMADLLVFRVILIFVNGQTLPLAACMKEVEDVVENLVKWNRADEAAFGFAQMAFDVLSKLFLCQVGRDATHGCSLHS